MFSKGKGVPRDWSKREVKDVMDFIEGCINSALEKSASTTGDDTTTTGDDVKVCCVVCSNRGVGGDVSKSTIADPLDH